MSPCQGSIHGLPCTDGCESDEPCGGTIRPLPGKEHGTEIGKCDGPCGELYVYNPEAVL